jgi:PPOX class probable F420-dependent enzyme
MIDEPLWQLVAANQHGVLATVSRDGRPQLSNVLFVVDQGEQMIRISTTADRVKARNLARDPRAALHVQGENFWAYAVAEGPVTLSEVAAEAGDDAGRELMAVHFAFYGDEDPDDFYTTVMPSGASSCACTSSTSTVSSPPEDAYHAPADHRRIPRRAELYPKVPFRERASIIPPWGHCR